MKYCTAKDAKLRLQRLCELCALCGETVNSNLQSAFICIHLRLISAEIQPNSFLLSPASRHFHSPALPLLTQPPLPLNLTACAGVLCVLAAASGSSRCGGSSTTQYYNAFTGTRHWFGINSGVVGAQKFEYNRNLRLL